MENPEEDSQETMQTHGEEPSKSSPEKVETNNGDGALALQLQEQVQSDDESELDKYDDDFDELNNQTGGKELQFSRLSEAICGLDSRGAPRGASHGADRKGNSTSHAPSEDTRRFREKGTTRRERHGHNTRAPRGAAESGATALCQGIAF